jgi:hypothetical protein
MAVTASEPKEGLKMSPLRRLVALPIAAAAALVLANSVLAVPPARTVDDVDVTFFLPDSACGFPLVQHVTGTFRRTEFLDGDAQPVRILESGSNFRITITNPANGVSITTVQAVVGHVTLNEDGSGTLALTGLQGHLKDPDGGFIREDIGRMVLFFPVEGPPTLVSQAGQFAGGPFPDVCDLLS